MHAAKVANIEYCCAAGDFRVDALFLFGFRCQATHRLGQARAGWLGMGFFCIDSKPRPILQCGSPPLFFFLFSPEGTSSYPHPSMHPRLTDRFPPDTKSKISTPPDRLR